MNKKRKGVVLIMAISISLILLIVGVMIVIVTIANIKRSVEGKKGLVRFYGAEGGIFAVAGYMTFYRRFDLPGDVLTTDSYDVEWTKLGENTVKRPPGYSVSWIGADVLINSKSPPNDPKAEIEAVVFIPVMPVGYGNE